MVSHLLEIFTVCIEDTSVVSTSEFRCLVQAESSSTALLNLHQETCISSLVQSYDIWYHAFLPSYSLKNGEVCAPLPVPFVPVGFSSKSLAEQDGYLHASAASREHAKGSQGRGADQT